MKGGKATGGVMCKSSNQVIENNIFADNDIGMAISMAPYLEPTMDNIVERNIFYNTGNNLYYVRASALQKNVKGGYENSFNENMVKDKSAFKSVNYNLIFPNYNQLDSLKVKGWDTHSIIGDPLFIRKNLPENRSHLDYELNPNSPVYQLGFKDIPITKIGLLNDFKFKRFSVKKTDRRIEAENYNRMKHLRTIASTGIYHIENGSWCQYKYVDFEGGNINQLEVFYLDELDFPDSERVFEVRTDSLKGDVIAVVSGKNKIVPVKSVKGIHDIYVIFKQPVKVDAFKFSTKRK